MRRVIRACIPLGLLLMGTVALTACNSSGGGGHHGSTPVSVSSIDASVAQDRWKGYVADVPGGRDQLVIELHNLSQDADLYIQGPRRHEYCESFRRSTRQDVCVFDYPTGGYWSIEVAGWDPGRTYYTLSTILEPSRSPVPVWLADEGIVALEQHSGLDATLDAGVSHGDIIHALVQHISAGGDDGDYQLIGADGRDGHATLETTMTPMGRAVHLKSAVDSAHGDERLSMRSVADHPIVLDAAGTPIAGRIRLRVDDRDIMVRLGMDTGTGADLQFVIEPGPLVRETPWISIATANWRIARED